MTLSPQNALMLRLLRSGPVHSHSLRRDHSIGDPARRAGELREAGFDVRSELARRGGRHGVLYRLHQGEPAGLGDARLGNRREGAVEVLRTVPAPGESPRAARRPSPSPSGTDLHGNRVWLVPQDARYGFPPVEGCVWTVDCLPASPWFGRSYWRTAPVAAEQQMELAA